MTVTDEDKAAVRRMLEALEAFNATISACSERRISVEFSEIQVMGKLNREFMCGKLERVTVERILP